MTLNEGNEGSSGESIQVAGSLRGRLLRRMAALLAVLLVISGLSAYFNGRQAADTAYDRTLLASARTIAAGLSESDGHLKASIPYIALDNFAFDSAGRIYYQVLGLDGQLVSGYEYLPSAPADTPLTRDYPALARFYNAYYRGQRVRVVSLQQPVSETTLSGIAEIRVAETEEARERMARGLLLDTLWRMTLLTLGAMALAWFMVTAALRPLEQLRQAVAERSPEDLRPLPVLTVQRELLPLVSALNLFTARLRHLLERQSQFIADAAHELRTPLAALKARLELGLREQSPDIWHYTLLEARHSSNRLAHLANQLLSWARIESSAQAVAEGSAERIELGTLARNLGLALAPLAHARGVALALEAEQDVWVMGEPTLLNELLSNLLDNAMAHTPAREGQVILRVLPPGLLEVEDNGPGIPESARQKVFERFHRLNPERDGAGLGLAIVGEICRAHQASIHLLDGQHGGLRVRVEFPPCKPLVPDEV